MSQEKKFPIPLKLLLLDFIGVLLAGLGLAKQFAELDVIPEQFRFDNYGLVFLVVGFALMLPLFYHVVLMARAKKPG